MTEALFTGRVAFMLFAWVTGVLLFWRLRTLDEEGTRGISWEGPQVSVIIPARNEEKNISTLLDSLQNQTYGNCDVIVVDDNSTDATKSLAEGYDVKVLHLEGDPPKGWIGKSWACWQGYLEARGDLLVFLDADVRLHPEAIEIFLKVQRKFSGLISVQPYHTMQKPYEYFSFVFNLVVIASMRVFSAWAPLTNPIGAFGPCLICQKADYEKAGTHSHVRGRVLEDLELGRAFRKQHLPVNNFLGGKRVSFRMYPEGLPSLVEGWSKNFATGAGSLDIVTLAILCIWITGSIATGFFDLRNDAWGTGLFLYFIYALQMFFISRKIGNFGILTAVLYPLYFLFFFLVFLLSLLRTFFFRSVKWKGRSIDLD
jgi:4,4'-diaponeurosporenoate glycosyltransferase